MKHRRMIISLVIMACLVFPMGSIHADSMLLPISGAVLNDQLNFKLENEAVVPVGDDGTPVLPISYNGTTYLPVRAIGYLLKLGIAYDIPSQTVVISSTSTSESPKALAQTKTNRLIGISNVLLNKRLNFSVDGVKAIPVGDDGTPVLPISYNGTTYLPVRAIGYLLKLDIGYDSATKTVKISKDGMTTQTTPVAKGWVLKTRTFNDGTKRTDSVLMGTSSGLYDMYSYAGNETDNDITITHNRYDTKTNALLAGVTYQISWTAPPQTLTVDGKVTVSFKRTTLASKSWTPNQNSIYLTQGMGVYFATPEGTTYQQKDFDAQFTTTKVVTKGSKGATKNIQFSLGDGFSVYYIYEWVE